MSMTVNAAVDLLISLLSQAAKVGGMIARARAAGRESLNESEIDELLADDHQARNDLQAAIERARAEGR